MRLLRSVLAAAIVALAIPASAPAQPPAPPPAAPQAPVPGAPVAAAPAPLLPPVITRTFTAPVGMWFLTVRPDRVADFEQVIGHLQAALAKSTDARVRQQASGWRMLKASEPGPNATVMYVFLVEPTIPGVDYALGPVLTSLYTVPTEMAEIWRMYTTSITGGGSLLNLTPVTPKLVPLGTKPPPVPVAPTTASPTTASPTTPPEQTVPQQSTPPAPK